MLGLKLIPDSKMAPVANCSTLLQMKVILKTFLTMYDTSIRRVGASAQFNELWVNEVDMFIPNVIDKRVNPLRIGTHFTNMV